MESPEQAATCLRFGAAPLPCEPESKVGIALHTAGQSPLNALRHPPEGETCGRYLWWGESLGDDPDFFQPLHIEHLADRCPEIVPYLCLPPGWRVILAPGYEDVWRDDSLLDLGSTNRDDAGTR